MEKQFEQKGEQHVIARMMELIKGLDVLYSKYLYGRSHRAWDMSEFTKAETSHSIPKEDMQRAEKLFDELKTLRESWKEDAPFQSFNVVAREDGLLVCDKDQKTNRLSYYLNDRKLPIDEYLRNEKGVVAGKKDGHLVFINKDHEVHTKYVDISREDNSFKVDTEKHIAAFSGTKENGKQVAVINGKEIGREYDYVQRFFILDNNKVVFVGGEKITVDGKRQDKEFIIYDGVELPETFTSVRNIKIYKGVLTITEDDSKENKNEAKLFAITDSNPITFKRITLEEANRDYK